MMATTFNKSALAVSNFEGVFLLMIPSLHPHKHKGILAMGQFYNRTVIIQFLIFILGRRLKFD